MTADLWLTVEGARSFSIPIAHADWIWQGEGCRTSVIPDSWSPYSQSGAGYSEQIQFYYLDIRNPEAAVWSKWGNSWRFGTDGPAASQWNEHQMRISLFCGEREVAFSENQVSSTDTFGHVGAQQSGGGPIEPFGDTTDWVYWETGVGALLADMVATEPGTSSVAISPLDEKDEPSDGHIALHAGGLVATTITDNPTWPGWSRYMGIFDHAVTITDKTSMFAQVGGIENYEINIITGDDQIWPVYAY